MNQQELEQSWQEWDIYTQKVACLLSLFAVSYFKWNLVEECLTQEDTDNLENILNHFQEIGLLQEPDEEFYLDEEIYLDEDSCEVPEDFHDFLRDKLENSDFAEELKRNFSQTMVALAKKMPEVQNKTEFEQFTQYIPHLKLVVTYLQDFISDEDFLKLIVNLGRFYQVQAEYESGISLLEAGVAAIKDRLGEEHPEIANILDNLADIYTAQGNYQKAEDIYKQALENRKKLQGKNRVDIAISLTKLATINALQGRYSDAETFFQVALAQRKNLLGEKHLDVATTINDLATIYLVQERYDEAEPLLVEALEIRKKIYGDRSLEVANSLNNLGQLYSRQGYYDKAEPLLVEALEIRQNLLGSEHGDVVTSLNNLAGVYESQARYQEAKDLYADAVQTAEIVLGDEHPKTRAIRRNFKLFLSELQEKSNYSLNSELTLYQPDGKSLTLQALNLTVEVEGESIFRCGLKFQISPQQYQDITSQELFHLETEMQLYGIGDGFEVDRDLEIQVELPPDLLSYLSKEGKTPSQVANLLLDLNRDRQANPKGNRSEYLLLDTESWYVTSVIQWVPVDEDLGEDVLIKMGYDTSWVESE